MMFAAANGLLSEIKEIIPFEQGMKDYSG